MNNARPSRRDLQAFQAALQSAASQSSRIPSLAELAARRDAHLKSLR